MGATEGCKVVSCWTLCSVKCRCSMKAAMPAYLGPQALGPLLSTLITQAVNSDCQSVVSCKQVDAAVPPGWLTATVALRSLL